VSCRDCDEKARGHAELDALAQAWIAAGKLRGFVEGVEWAVRCLTPAAEQLARAPLRTRLLPAELRASVLALGPAILERVEQRRAEALQAESAARTLTSSVRLPASRRGILKRLEAALAALAE
jgi:hypothetical protein